MSYLNWNLVRHQFYLKVMCVYENTQIPDMFNNDLLFVYCIQCRNY